MNPHEALDPMFALVASVILWALYLLLRRAQGEWDRAHDGHARGAGDSVLTERREYRALDHHPQQSELHQQRNSNDDHDHDGIHARSVAR